MEKTLETLLVEQCAPTLAGIKPASLFPCRGARAESLRAAAYWDRELAAAGLRLRVLRSGCVRDGDCLLLYVYRVRELDRILERPENRRILRLCGYTLDGGGEAVLSQLAARLRDRGDFPHEIGVFLGYPARDVLGFIRHRGKDFKLCGYWKVYGDAEFARRCFDRYTQCTRQLVRRFENGTPVLHLTVAA